LTGGYVSLKLVLFDLWGTLFQHEGPGEDHGRGAMRVAMAQEALAASGFDYDTAMIETAFARAIDALAKIHADGLDITAEARTVLLVEHLDPTLAGRLDDAALRRVNRAVLTPALIARPLPMPGGVQVLREVKALGLPVGLVSNAGATPGFVLREIMDGYGLLEHFDDTVFSDEVELSKPSPAIFERALEPFGVAPEEAAFIGDQPVLDVLGPRQAGLWTVQLGDLAADGIEPHARVGSLGEVVPALRELGLLDELATTAPQA
jgi:HAD superfamily hydrolase (TIGR01509 family)